MPEKTEGSQPYTQVSVVGAGAWGTALAMVAAVAGRQTILWAREADVVETIARDHRNTRFLPDMALPRTLTATGDLARAAQAEALLIAAPAQYLRATLQQLAPHVTAGTPLMLCAKGIERDSGKLLTEVLRETMPRAEPAILSGPSFAIDVARGMPTAVTIAARSEVAQRLQATLGHATFRPYASQDMTGVALGGAAKNVYAIACGIVEGMGLGESARAALLARGFAELCRLGEAIGAKRETLMGLAGLGDLVLTATSPTSRNFALGCELGRGRRIADLVAPGRPLAEGVETAPALVARARREKLELPVAEAVAAVLSGALPLDKVLLSLMSRPLGTE